jgi:thiol-disulfide isomerase/thioredoxin
MNPNSASLLRARPARVGVSALAAVWCLVGAAPLAGAVEDPVARTPASPPQASKPSNDAGARAAKAAEEARLQVEYERIAADLRKSIGFYQADISGLQQQAVPRENWPPHPNVVYYPLFEELAVQDQPDALRWCLATVGQTGRPLPEVLEKKNELYARLVIAHPDLAWMSDLARWVQADASVTGIGFERGDALLEMLAENTTVRATRCAAIAARAAIHAPRTDAASRALHQKFLRELVEKYPDLPAGAGAKGQLFQVEHLVPGKSPPDVQAVDTEGKALRLADYRGKVLVLDFWGFWCTACVRGLPEIARLVKQHANEPFAFLGVATDTDLAEFQKRARESNVTWRNAWTNGTDGTWPISWGVQRYPTVYVLDAQGVVRFVDLRGNALDRAVQSLLDEMKKSQPPAPR